MYDSEGLRILTEDECRDLLGTVPLGRVVFTDRALPAVQPVSFALSDGEVIIVTAAGSKLSVAVRDAIVAFETDDFDPEIAEGWSVVVIGHARVIENGDRDRLSNLPLPPRTPDESTHYIAITPELISGRRLPTV